MKISHIKNPEEMMKLGEAMAKLVPSQFILYLNGPLGAGKTTFARGFIHGFGYSGKVKSPTYTLVEPYHHNGQDIFHFDLYRIHDEQELIHIGLEDYFSQPAIFMVEWAEKAPRLLPQPDLICSFKIEDTQRMISLNGITPIGKEVIANI